LNWGEMWVIGHASNARKKTMAPRKHESANGQMLAVRLCREA
jgi:hypothetical protein